MLKKYHVFFRWPGFSTTLSGMLSAYNITVLLWVPWLLWQHVWVPAALLAVNYWVAGSVAWILRPRQFLHATVEEHDNRGMMPEMQAVDRVCERLGSAGLQHARSLLE